MTLKNNLYFVRLCMLLTAPMIPFLLIWNFAVVFCAEGFASARGRVRRDVRDIGRVWTGEVRVW